MRFLLTTALLSLTLHTQAAEPLRIAVAANLLPVMERITHDYQQHGGQPVQLAGGSSGAFFEQIRRGAPFDLFFSADAERPQQLVAAGIGQGAHSYACGRLALWTPRHRPDLNALPAGKLAIAQPDTAPYGKAALQALERSGQLQAVKPHLVYAQDIGQAYQFVSSGNAPAGLVALSQLRASQIPAGQYAALADTLYRPLLQKRILLATGTRAALAEDFLQFFEAQQSTLKNAGYILPGEPGCAAE